MRKLKKTISVLLAVIMAFSVISAFPFTASAAEVESSNSVGVESGDYEYEILDDGTAEITKYNGEDTELVIPSEIDGYKVTSIGYYAFYKKDCTSLTIPDSVTNIGYYAFGSCKGLTSITIPDSVTDIGYYAFGACSNISEIKISDNITSMGEEAFSGTAWYKNQPDGTVYIDNILYKFKGSMLENTSLEINEGTKIISNGAFRRYENLTDITIPDTVTNIGAVAFQECTGLTNVTIPDSVTNIGEYAFDNCNSLTNVTIPDGIITINDGTFYNCSSLTEVTIPDSVTNIGEYAFRSCTSLSILTIPNSVTSIDSSAFYETDWLNNQPDGLLYINDVLYAYKGDLTEKTTINIKEGTKSITDRAFINCLNLLGVIIPNSVTNIGEYAFGNCKNLTEITIPNSVTSIGNYAFYNCLNLSDVTISDGVEEIGSYVFENCKNLKSVIIPLSVVNINDKAFGYNSYENGDYGITYKKVDDFTIYGYSGTAAEDYAKENGFEFVELGDVVIGDLSGDGEIDINDATMIQKFGVGINTPEVGSALFKRADVNGDGRISILDVTCVQKYLVGGYKNTGLLGK